LGPVPQITGNDNRAWIVTLWNWHEF